MFLENGFSLQFLGCGEQAVRRRPLLRIKDYALQQFHLFEACLLPNSIQFLKYDFFDAVVFAQSLQVFVLAVPDGARGIAEVLLVREDDGHRLFRVGVSVETDLHCERTARIGRFELLEGYIHPRSI